MTVFIDTDALNTGVRGHDVCLTCGETYGEHFNWDCDDDWRITGLPRRLWNHAKTGQVMERGKAAVATTAAEAKKLFSGCDPDWPDKCPGCGGPAYHGAGVMVECRAGCRPQYRRAP